MTTRAAVKLTEYDPKDIEVGWRVRTDLGDINELAQSIAQVGQLQPIVAVNGAGKPRIVAGLRRLKACQQLKRKVVVRLVEPQDELQELDMQLAENTKRKDFDQLEMSEGLTRRKKLYVALHPETKPGATGGGLRGKGTKTKADLAAPGKPPAERFTLSAARAMGVGETKVIELIAISKLGPKHKKQIKAAKTATERNKAAQDALRQVRIDRKMDKLQQQADAKRQRKLDEPKDTRPSVYLHYGANEDFLKGEELYDLVLTDPPYDRERSLISHAARASINKKQGWDKLDVGWVLRAAPTLVKGGQMIIFCPLEAIGSYELAIEAAGLDYRMALVWCKTNPGTAHRPTYVSAVEAIVWAVKPGGKVCFRPWETQAGAEALNYIRGPLCQGSERLHPTQKPEWIISRLIGRHTLPGMHVVDPFAGAGTTGVVCRKLGLACTMIENDDKYIKMAKQRLEALG